MSWRRALIAAVCATVVAGGAHAQFFGGVPVNQASITSALTGSTTPGAAATVLASQGTGLPLTWQAVPSVPGSACTGAGNALQWTGSVFACQGGFASGLGAGSVNTFTAEQIFAGAGAASTPGLLVDGTLYTGGSGSTTEPLAYIAASGITAPTSWSTNGTLLGIVGPSGTCGNLIDARESGASTIAFQISCSGSITSNGSFTAGGGSAFLISAKTKWLAQAVGDFSIENTSGTLYWEMDQYGHVTTTTGAINYPPTCGTGCASISGNDNNMQITSGSAVTAVSINFGHAWASAPTCAATVEGTTPIALSISGKTTSVLTVNLASSMTSGVIDLKCGL